MIKIKFIFTLILFLFVLGVFFSCLKDKGIDPEVAYSDAALLDSCKNESAFVFYKNNPNIVYSGIHGPHGTFKLKFNKVANLALTDNGKLPVGAVFPNKSMVVKEVIFNGKVALYAFMYKFQGSWLWGEMGIDGNIIFSVKKDPSSCINCHNQSGHRDLVDSFNFY